MTEEILSKKTPAGGERIQRWVWHNGGGITLIESNGSKWAGQAPDSLDELKRRLRENTLDPTFEEYGNFYTLTSDAWAIVPKEYEPFPWHFWGNFEDVSGVFSVFTCDEETLDELCALIEANKAMPAYRQAKAERQQRQKERREREAFAARRPRWVRVR